MQLKELASLLAVSRIQGDETVEITGIQMDSRRVQPGDLFVCVRGIPGKLEDRHPYAEDAVRNGACALVVERDVDVDAPKLFVKDARWALARIASHFYGYPSREMKLIGVTGTNGKTTTSHMLEKILRDYGFRTGLMGNIGITFGSETMAAEINTQQCPDLQRIFRKMRDASTEYCIMEVTSEGIDMGRVLGCHFRTAVFTNLTQDHLDYHGSMERYRAVKGLLFSRLGNTFGPGPEERKFAVLNADDPASEQFASLTAAEVITYGIDNPADVFASNIRVTPQGNTFDVSTFAGEAVFHTRLVGKFNVYNALAATAAALAEGIPLEHIRRSLAQLSVVPGRMEAVDAGQPFLVLVDYAHTPDGLENALAAIRQFAEGKVITVFGCGGDRDRGKRPLMGGIAAAYSDFVFVTSDNPRSENPEAIMRDIEPGLANSGYDKSRYAFVADRRTAIARAIEMANPRDVVLIAGKGHETYQIVNGITHHFDDRETAREAIAALSRDV